MPQMMTNQRILAVLVAGAFLALAGCSSPNNQSGFNTETGKHAPQWSMDHRTAFLKDPSICTSCHGTDLKGGVANVSCFSASFSGVACHANGPSGHPANWMNPDAHGAIAKGAPGTTFGFSLCQICHGYDFVGGLAQKSCLNTAGCHGANVNAPHSPKPWRGTVRTHTNTDPGNAPVCATCHTNGANSSVQPSPPAPAGTAPGCFNNTLCHATPTSAACGTCHGIPPNGTSLPNVAGKHAVHASLGSYVICASCHSGAGSGTALHQNGTIDVALDPAYNSKSGTATYNVAASTCSNVSCHGGQTTPGWLSGTVIDVNTQCTSCHAPGTTQYNSNNSGHHSTHASRATCYYCHDTALLAVNHFTSLNTTAMEGPAAATISKALNYVPGGTPGTGSCTPSCHGNRSW